MDYRDGWAVHGLIGGGLQQRPAAQRNMSSSNLYHFCRSLYHFVCITFVDRRNVDLSSPVDHVNAWGCSICYTCQIQCLTSCIQGTPAAGSHTGKRYKTTKIDTCVA